MRYDAVYCAASALRRTALRCGMLRCALHYDVARCGALLCAPLRSVAHDALRCGDALRCDALCVAAMRCDTLHAMWSAPLLKLETIVPRASCKWKCKQGNTAQSKSN